ncbi:MAG TPA: DUF4349 domain-containing protein [Solirubrobacterales bacterium]|nr:DUF4349 domain-containing protein [Solirubrobacterales bacterium]
METPRDEQLAADLRALRPAPRPEFAAELDGRAAAGFPRRTRLPRVLEWLRAAQPRKLLIPAGGIAVVAIALITAVVAMDEGGGGSSAAAPRRLMQEHDLSPAPAPETAKPSTRPEAATEEVAPEIHSSSSSAAAGGAKELNFDGSGSYSGTNEKLQPFSSDIPTRIQNRAVERSAELVLGAAPADVGEDSSAVFEAVHAHDGIVLRSSTREGKAGVAAARFELLIPSAKLGDALAALSAIDEVRSRHEATDDITAPTVATGELLQDSKARIDSLLAQLETAETESEREAVEAELAQERRHRARLRGQLQQLERRADYSRVLVRIESGDAEGATGGGAWGVGDALDDAGHILAVAAAVSLVALAILGPIALIALLAWLTHRAWVRRERRRVLS